jgi:hypothetical protein
MRAVLSALVLILTALLLPTPAGATPRDHLLGGDGLVIERESFVGERIRLAVTERGGVIVWRGLALVPRCAVIESTTDGAHILYASADFLPYPVHFMIVDRGPGPDGGRFTTNPTTEDRCGASDLEPVGLGPLSLGFATLPLQT